MLDVEACRDRIAALRTAQRQTRQYICLRCERLFEDSRPNGVPRKYCEECRPVVSREQRDKRIKEYRQTDEGRAKSVESARKYRSTPEGRAASVDAMRLYRSFPDNRVKRVESNRVYYRTTKGKASKARMHANNRKRSTNTELYAARVKQLHVMHEDCAECNAPYKASHQIDHILALCLGGTDDWGNLQPLCILCHRVKTGNDLSRLAVVNAK